MHNYVWPILSIGIQFQPTIDNYETYPQSSNGKIFHRVWATRNANTVLKFEADPQAEGGEDFGC